ncbi:MAG: UDP-3-O-acyl-N-acetylglucosamine deacetylase [Gammaproteobacteria bacterium]
MNSLHEQSVMQRTLSQSISYVGIGLHTGKNVNMVIKPAKENSGINFLRKDIKTADNLIPALWYNVVDTTMSTVLGNNDGITIGTVEHLMAALLGCGVDNALVEIDGPEVPIMDGSAAPFVSVIEKIGTFSQSACRNAIWIHRPVEVRDGDKYSILMPSSTPRITVEIDFKDSAIGSQTHSVTLINGEFRHDIARARTFGFASDIKQLQHNGLAKGGSLKNAILVDGGKIVNEEGLRYDNEFVRHKILDALGDLALVGVPIIGHIYARKPGHKLNNALIRQLIDSPDAWSYNSINNFNSLTGADRHDNIDNVIANSARIHSASY